MKTTLNFETIYDFHDFGNLPKPQHPLISLIDYSLVQYPPELTDLRWVQNFYSIGLKRNVGEKFNYGQQEYDFHEGVLALVAPKQVLSIEINPNVAVEPSGWLLLIHPDFFLGNALSRKIKHYEFFGYAVNEALFLSQKEEDMLMDIFKKIRNEYEANIDTYTQNIILSHVELLLNYTERFYGRQFITRKATHNQVLNQLELLLENRFNAINSLEQGIPSVQEIADALHFTPNYLTSLLKSLTGQSTQQHIHDKLIEKAKEKLSTTELSVSEIAYELGFEHPTSFSKLFKKRTQLSPLKFRAGFN